MFTTDSNQIKDNKREKLMPTMIVATPPPRARTATVTATITTPIATIFKIPLHQIHLKMNHPVNQLENGKREQP